MKKIILLIFLLLGYSEVSGQIYYEGNGHQNDCDTKRDGGDSIPISYIQYDANTRITIYGDSRTDFADSIPYNFSNMNALLGADTSIWNVQNFGVAGWTSDDLFFKLIECFKIDPSTGAPINSNYVTATKVAFEIGGNDILHMAPFLYSYRWLLPISVLRSKANIDRIVSIFQRRNKKILLIGNYPAGGMPSGMSQLGEHSNTYPLSLGFALSIGLMALENEYVELVNRRQIEYIRVWDYMALYPGAPVPRADLTFGDLIHPSPAGFQVWGQAVGNKIRELGWHLPDTPPEPPPPNVDDTSPDGTTNPNPPPPAIDPILLCFLLKICHL
ncbi:SGNH/GDSL hydrolase family protein [Leptospira koniambonensis]|uniref:SGNH/GDSL hydrolase family protein n=1 Tax=Leptospira koniambonensis TaxID=2484950 RepID=A0A4R9J250_9LEPT|nr:SGNH/GDSL hydrolase family protein [Leptospira koniambonensis]TGL28465.1 SGNH/GDSL hydrolase family protein [Leptospira koniambonensis]